MKAKNVLIALGLLAITCSGHAQNLPSYVPANGLVGWLPFNGNANDESGNNHNGTVSGATLTTDRFGNNEKAYYFDKLNGNFISVPDVAVEGSGERTISFWSKTNSNNIQNAIMAISTGSSVLSSAFNIRFETSNTFVGFMGFDNDFLGSGNVVVNDNNWHHVLVTYQSGQLRFYIDGVFEKETNISLSTSGQNNFIGKSNHDIHPDYFLGSLDDFGFWNRALTQQEITALYQGANTTANCLDLPSNLQQGLVGYWPFCGNANDESGNGINLTNNNVGFSADRFGNQNAAASFNGSNSYLRSDVVSKLKPRSFTISCWHNKSNSSGPKTVVALSPPTWQWSTPYKIAYMSTSGNPFVLINRMWTPSTSWQDIEALNFATEDNVWYHSIMTYDSASQIQKFYVGNVLTGTRTSQLDYSTYPLEGFYVGATRESLTGDLAELFTGSIDDIAIWNRALSQEEISQLYNQAICKTSITVTDTLLIHTGITAYNPVAYGNTLKVWPNPGNQDITLDAGNLASMQGWKYKVANTLGQTVVNETAISQQQTLIDLSTWGGNGIYYLHLINPQGHAVEIKKIVLAP